MENKTQKLENILKKLNIDGLFLTDMYNLRYFTGFTGTTGAALVTKEKKYFFSDFRYKKQATEQVTKMGFEFVESRTLVASAGEFVKKLGLKNVGFEDNNVSFALYQTIKENFSSKLTPVGNELILQRMKKSEKEIEIIKKAIEISDIAFTEVLGIIKEGVSEKEIAAHLEYTQRKLGASDRSFDTIVASGLRSAMPHGVASDKKIQKDEFITMDFGAYYDGYVSDITRTVYYGQNITNRHREVYNTVLAGQLLGIKTIKAGMYTDEVDKAVRDFFESKNLGEYFGHGLGHGIGLEIHELPYLSKSQHLELEENMIVTVEPGLYFDGFGGARIEDDVVVTKNGCEVLNKSQKELIIIEWFFGNKNTKKFNNMV